MRARGELGQIGIGRIGKRDLDGDVLMAMNGAVGAHKLFKSLALSINLDDGVESGAELAEVGVLKRKIYCRTLKIFMLGKTHFLSLFYRNTPNILVMRSS